MFLKLHNLNDLLAFNLIPVDQPDIVHRSQD